MDIRVARKPKNLPGITPGKRPGTYRIQYYDWNGSHRTKVFNGSLPDAVKLRRSLLAKVDRIKNGLEAPEKKTIIITLGDLWEEFQKEYQLKVDSGSIEPSSFIRYKFSIEALIEYQPALESKSVADIGWKDIEEFKIYRQSKGFAPDGINTNLRNIRTIFNYALSKGILNRNPMHNVLNVKTGRRDVRYLNEDELETISGVIESINLQDPFEKDGRDLALFYLFTGARASEVLYPHFEWSCIGKDSIYFPKTKMSDSRKIPLTDSIRKVLESRTDIIGGPFFHLIDQKVTSIDDLVNCHMTYDMAYKRVKHIFKKASLEDVSLHTLRKTAGAYYYIATRDIFATSRFLGHSSVNVTESHYVGLIQSLQAEYSRQFDQALQNHLKSIL
ncbi:MAG: tyrosine-type recombinase/integrase [Candidatus Neomarinimicrobiota bacterium]